MCRGSKIDAEFPEYREYSCVLLLFIVYILMNPLLLLERNRFIIAGLFYSTDAGIWGDPLFVEVRVPPLTVCIRE